MAPTRALSQLLLPLIRHQRSFACLNSALPKRQYYSNQPIPSLLLRLDREYGFRSSRRFYSNTDISDCRDPQPPDYLSATELKIFEKLKRELGPSKLEVQDISGGCGSMFAIDIVSNRFEGMKVIRQHRLVNEILKEEIKDWHGLQLKTKVG